jgi:hypothetical protein
MIIVSIDPGKWCLPWCVWQDGVLVSACLSVLPAVPGMRVSQIASNHFNNSGLWTWGTVCGKVCIEQLSLNSGRDKTRGKAIATGNDLLDLTSIAALVAGLLRAPVEYLPVATWKGTAPKSVTQNRVRATLTLDELQVLESAFLGVRKGLHHNLYDAAGIGLHATNRYRIRGATK